MSSELNKRYKMELKSSYYRYLNFNTILSTIFVLITFVPFTLYGQIQMVDIPEGRFECIYSDNPDKGEMINIYRFMHRFKMSKTEITQSQWEAVMQNNPSHFKGSNLPVENVSWNDIQLFLLKLNWNTGMNYSLPDEFEWKYASGGDEVSTQDGYAGTDVPNELGLYAWFVENSDSSTHPVSTKLPNKFGLYDMNGNVSEWCKMREFDKCANCLYKDLPDSISTIYGGSWKSNANDCKVKKRIIGNVDIRNDDLGFRLVIEP